MDAVDFIILSRSLKRLTSFSTLAALAIYHQGFIPFFVAKRWLHAIIHPMIEIGCGVLEVFVGNILRICENGNEELLQDRMTRVQLSADRIARNGALMKYCYAPSRTRPGSSAWTIHSQFPYVPVFP
jgi:hypothetical protein